MSKLRYLLLAVITIVTTWATGQNTLTEQVYWIDNDIGTKKPLGPSVATIDVSQLSKGLHSITTQVKDSKGQWSVPVTKYFIIPKATTGQNTLTEQVYWIDNNIGTKKPLGPSVATIDVSQLSKGLHSITTQVKDSKGQWSVPVTKYFIIPKESQMAKTIVERDYWIDNALNTRQPLGESVATINISSLALGVHSLTMRVKDNLGQWSTAMTRFFIKTMNLESENTIVRCVYWFDDQNEASQTVEVDEATGTVLVDVSNLTAGKHNLFWRVCDSKGAWSDTFVSEDFMRYTVPESGIGTFSAATAMTLPEGLTAHYTTTTKTSGKKLYANVGNISGNTTPANTGLLLKGEGGLTFTLLQSTEVVTQPEDNTLVPVVEATHVEQTNGDYTNFILYGGKFVVIAEDGKEVKIPDNRAYLPVLTTIVGGNAAAKSVILVWDNLEATGIDGTPRENTQAENGKSYNLNGQRVGKDYKGIVIMTGKKVLKK